MLDRHAHRHLQDIVGSPLITALPLPGTASEATPLRSSSSARICTHDKWQGFRAAGSVGTEVRGGGRSLAIGNEGTATLIQGSAWRLSLRFLSRVWCPQGQLSRLPESVCPAGTGDAMEGRACSSLSPETG